MGSVPDHNILRWNDFQSQIAANLQDLRDEDEFVDVTVACDENSQIQAHKLILSACSPYFRALLRKAGPNVPHPILIMPADTRYQDLVSLIDFMYHGEVAIPTEDVSQFLGLAEQFKVKGLYNERPKQQPPGQFRPTGSHGPPKPGSSRPPPGPNLPPDIRGRLPPGISMMKSGGPSPHKRPRLEQPPHHPLGPPARHHGALHHGGSQHDDSVDDIQEIRDEEDSNDFYPGYGEEYEEGAGGWGEGEPGAMQPQQQQQQPPPPQPGARGPQLMGLLCPNCRTMCQGVPALKEHMAVCQGSAAPSQPGGSGGHFQPGQPSIEEVQECHVCDKSFKSHRTLDNHMKKQHGISAPPRQPPMPTMSRAGRGRPKKPTTMATAAMGGHHGLEVGEEGSWSHPHEAGSYAGGHSGQMGGPHKELSARPVGQVAPAQRPLPPSGNSSGLPQPKTPGQSTAASADTESAGPQRPSGSSSSGGPAVLAVSSDDMRRNQPSPRGGSIRGRGGMPIGGPRGGHHPGPSPHFPRPGSSGGIMPPKGAGGLGVGSGVAVTAGGSGDAHHPPPPPVNRPDLQKLGLKFGGQISITSTGNQGGKRGPGGGVDAQGVSITKLKGDMPVGSPVSIRDATANKQQQGGSSGRSNEQPHQQDGAGAIKEEPSHVKEEPKDFVEGEGMEEGHGDQEEEEEGAGDFGEEEDEDEEEYGEGEFEQDDGLYQGDGDFEGMEGEMEEEEEEFMEGGRTGMFQGQYGDGYPEIGGDYEEEG